MNTESMQQPAGSQATVICLHSSGSTGGQWTALRAQLEPDVRVLTPDFHGHGAGPAWHGFDEDIVAADAARIARLADPFPAAPIWSATRMAAPSRCVWRSTILRAWRASPSTNLSCFGCCSIITAGGGPHPKSSRSRATCAADCGPATPLALPPASSITGAAAVRGAHCRSVSKPAS